MHSVGIGCYVAGGVAAAGALLAVTFLPVQPLVLDGTPEVDDGTLIADVVPAHD